MRSEGDASVPSEFEHAPPRSDERPVMAARRLALEALEREFSDLLAGAGELRPADGMDHRADLGRRLLDLDEAGA
jgi:hypothetical protein